ncbi:hypothetical protein Rhe02_47060 [Rhizocola hellebori]|uniref:Ribbon-helix-helix protein, CopG family n=1 Tax=Rhizocola hellebori TaxID=1392758 RepID=A0A8J3VGR4_9ACTN|nr:hypothetical protein [Rhizocola hellebori]GIH06639.1 hypothetical protein Rhe02_47060 [Rhizocola hellebori]
MTDVPSANGPSGGFKTIGVKLPDEVHAQLVLIASLDGLSLTDAIRQAIDGHLDRKRSDGALAARAAEAAAEIEREAALRRDALQALFGPQSSTPDETTTSKRRTKEQTSP